MKILIGRTLPLLAILMIAPAATAQQPDERIVTGVVDSYERDVLRLATLGETVEILVLPTTAGPKDQLKRGIKVSVTCVVTDAALVAKEVKLEAPTELTEATQLGGTR